MVIDSRRRPNLTPRGRRTRARIVDAAAQLMWTRGVVRTTLDEVRAGAGVSGSQMSHYFADKYELIRAVVDHQAAAILDNQQRADLGSPEGLKVWRDMIVAQAQMNDASGGCPLGSLGSQLAESDTQARNLVAAGFDSWSAALAELLRALKAAGHLSSEVDPDELGVTLLAVLQGGLLLAQVQRNGRPLEIAVDTILKLATTAMS